MKILLIQLRRIGDVMMCTPAIRSIKKAYPAAEIHFLTEQPSDQILQYNPFINKIIALDKKTTFKHKIHVISNLRKEGYDLVIDFHNNPSSGWLSLLSGANKRVGKYHKLRKIFYSDTAKLNQYKYEGYAKFDLLETIGISPIFNKIDFFISEKERSFAKNFIQKLGVKENEKIITVSPVSRQPYKVWPAEKFSKICDYLIEKYNVKILFIYGPGEEHFTEKVRSFMKNRALPDYPPVSLAETRAIFEHATMHVGNDNGPMHIAISAGIPTVAVFGRPFAAGWTPPDSDINVGIENPVYCKSNCTYPDCKLECIKSIKTETVLNKIEKLIKKKELL